MVSAQRQEVQEAVEVILQLADNDPTAVVGAVAEILCVKFKKKFPNAQVGWCTLTPG